MKRHHALLYFFAFCFCVFGLFQNCSKLQTSVIDQQDFSSYAYSLDSDPSFFYSQKNSLVMLNKTPVFAEAASAILSLTPRAESVPFRFFTSDNTEEAKIEFTKNSIKLWHITDADNYTYGEYLYNSPDAIIVAAHFGRKPKDMKLLINGRLRNLNFRTKGTPLDYSYLIKASPQFDSTGGIISSAQVFTTALSPLELSGGSLTMAIQTEVTGVTVDPSLPSQRPDGDPNETAQFAAAKAVIDQNCTSCHNNSNIGDFRNLSQSGYIQKGLVIARNPASSPIYYRLTGAKSGPGPATMPPNSPLAESQLTAIETWINGL